MKNRVILIAVSVFCLAFLGASTLMAWKLVRQIRTRGWPAAAQGEVVSGRVTAHAGSKGGTVYGAEIKYRYRVGDVWRDGSTVSLSGEIESSGGGHARETVARYPVGPVTVYYNPADPTETVLQRGMQDHQWAMVGFIAPFLCFPLTILSGVCCVLLRRGRRYVGTVKVFEPAAGVWVARASTWGPLAGASTMLLPMSILMIASTLIAPTAWARGCIIVSAALGASAMVAAFEGRRRWLASGRLDTVIDANTRTLIPARGKSSTADSFPLERVNGARLLQERPPTEKNETPWHVHVTFEGEAKSRRIAEVWNKADAAAFEQWLNERIDAVRGRDGRTARAKGSQTVGAAAR